MSNEDTLRALGNLAPDDAQRDAVHIAVAPVVADQAYRPGQPYKGVGVVDPFLRAPVKSGERFWLFLNPGSITSLRHDWTHPAFDEEAPDKTASEEWLRNFVKTADCPDYDTLMAAATGNHQKNYGDVDSFEGDMAQYNKGYYNSKNDGEYLYFGGLDAHGEIPSEFWDHVEIVSGQKIPEGLRAKFFSCSC